MDSPTDRTHLSLTVVRLSSGWRSLLPARGTSASGSGWRPIVTVCADSPDCHAGESHEVQLGTDGQNPNLRTPFMVAVEPRTKLALQVWQQAQTKKKSARKTLVASHKLDVALAIRRYGADAHLELPLHPQGVKPARTRIRGQRSPASVFVKLCAPSEWASSSARPEISITTQDALLLPDQLPPLEPFTPRARKSSTTPQTPVPKRSDSEPEVIVRAPTPTSTLRQRKTKKPERYHLFSDTDGCSELSNPSSPALSEHGGDPPPQYSSDIDNDDNETPRPRPTSYDGYFSTPAWEVGGWIAASIIPQYVSDTVSIASTRSRAETVFDSFTPFLELRAASDADSEEDFQKILDRLKHEWYAVGASLIALAGLDAAAFGFQSGQTMFEIDEFAMHMVALSSVATGLGLCATVWMLLWYSYNNPRKFQRAALDIYGTYGFFALTCRVPAILMATAAISLTAFMVRVAWFAWPTATLMLSLLAGVAVGLQYLVWCVHSAARVVIWTIKGCRRRVLGALAKQPQPGVDAEMAQDASTPATHIASPTHCVIGEALAEIHAESVHPTPAEAIAQAARLSHVPFVDPPRELESLEEDLASEGSRAMRTDVV